MPACLSLGCKYTSHRHLNIGTYCCLTCKNATSGDEKHGLRCEKRKYFNYLRHYIYIDSDDINKNINTDPTLAEIKRLHKTYYTNDEEIKYWGYMDIYNLIKEYDEEFAELFLSINVNYPALLADIGRYLILYRFGGVYHDLKCVSNLNMISYLDNTGEVIFIGETNPLDPGRVRNTNIVTLIKTSPLLLDVLTEIKKKLLIAKQEKWHGSKKMVYIGSRTYKDIFDIYKSDLIIKIPMVAKRLLIFDSTIYKKNSRSWQKTEEFIFNQT